MAGNPLDAYDLMNLLTPRFIKIRSLEIAANIL